jgi:tetratricopeptide (TPR) repeat protein
LLLKRGRLGLLGFAMLFPWLLFMTELSTIRIQENFVLYRSYLWAVGACAVLPLLLDKLDKRMAGIVVVALALALFPIAMERLASFSHPLIMWDDAEKLVKDKPELPGAYRIYYNRGTELIKVDDYDAAIQDLTLSVKLHPDWPYAYNNLGSAYLKKAAWQEASDAFTKAIDIATVKSMGINPRPYVGRALAYENLGRPDLAQRDYQVTCKVAKKGCEYLKK